MDLGCFSQGVEVHSADSRKVGVRLSRAVRIYQTVVSRMLSNPVVTSTWMGTHSSRPVDPDKEVMVRKRLKFLWPSASDGIILSGRILERWLIAIEVRVQSRIVVLIKIVLVFRDNFILCLSVIAVDQLTS